MNRPSKPLLAGTRLPWVVAHRGASADHPENTLAALRAAAALPGVDAVECDVRLSRDGIPVVIHDPDLRRLAGRELRVDEMTAAELRAVDAGGWFGPEFAGEPVPLLRDVLEALPHAHLWLELKVDPPEDAWTLAQAAAACIKAAAPASDIRVLSFDPQALTRIRIVSPETPRIRLLRAPPDGSRAWDEAVEGCCAVDIHHRLLSAALVREAHRRDCAVVVYTCNTAEEADRAISLGADAVTTDRPAWLTRRLRG